MEFVHTLPFVYKPFHGFCMELVDFLTRDLEQQRLVVWQPIYYEINTKQGLE